MRVLHIGKFYPPYPGGIENFSADLAEAQVQRGIVTAVLAHAPPGTRRTFQREQNGVDVTLIACLGQLVHAPISPTFLYWIERTVRRFKPDLLHLHLPNTSALLTLLSPAARRVPWVVHWHADIPLDAADWRLRIAYRLYRPLEQALLRRARAVIATSQRYADSSPALASWTDRLHVIPLGLDALHGVATAPTGWAWPSAPATPDPLRILTVGRLAYFKGHDVLLRALARMPDAALLLVGSGPREAALRALASKLGIEARVSFAGSLAWSDGQLALAYAQAEVFCLPSIERSESFGLVLLEAMRARRAVVASDIAGSGVGHVVLDNDTGLLVPPGNVDALAHALARMRDEPALRDRLAAAGHARWAEKFTLDAVVKSTHDLYRSVLAD